MAVNSLILDSKKTFYNDKIDSCVGDQKELFKTIDKIMHNFEEPQLPSHNSLDELVNKFAFFFVTKISEIRKQVINNSTSNTWTDEKILSPELLADFHPATENEIKKLIKESPSKSCSDPIPTWLIKKCIDYLVPIITVGINLSLSSGNMPSNLKEAILIPLIKKACLNPEIFNHFRPISNLTYLSKHIEKVVATRLFDHMTTNGLHECLQSSYQKYHSTETALTCIHDDILRAVDEKQCVIFLLLDLGAAFDTIDHDMLLSRLRKYIGLRDTAFNWFRSYLSQRQQSVLINGVKSKMVPLSCGVPQGLVLGPILFTIYLLPLGDTIRKPGLKFHMYADDCQLYISFSMSTNEAVSSMQMAIDDIRAWYAANMLKLNDDKTEMLVIGSKYRTIPKLPDLNVGSTVITPGEHVRNLGVIMDTKFTMEPHITKIMQIAFLKIRQNSYYRKLLTPSAAKTLIHAYITSKLDYCNGLLHGLPTNIVAKLQSILNTAARLVTKTR